MIFILNWRRREFYKVKNLALSVLKTVLLKHFLGSKAPSTSSIRSVRQVALKNVVFWGQKELLYFLVSG